MKPVIFLSTMVTLAVTAPLVQSQETDAPPAVITRPAPTPKQAILAVIRIALKEHQDCLVKLQNGKFRLDLKKQVALYTRIDTSDCPADFRQAWREYVLAQFKQKTVPGSEFITDLIAAPATSGASLLPLLRDSANAQQETIDDRAVTTENLMLVCSSYGIK